MSRIETPLTEAVVPAAPPTGSAVRGWLVPAIIGSAMLMQTLSATVLTNALPTMARALDEDPLRLNLAITMYLLATAVFLPVSGWLADKLGAKRVFVVAMALYALSSAGSGLATDLTGLVIARVFQGAAGAMMVPVGRLVLLRTTPRNELVGAMSILTMPALLGPVIGPILGGAIVTFADWRWIFFMNLPIAIAGMALVIKYVPNVKEQTVSPLDWLGILLTGIGLAALIFGFENLGRNILSAWVVAGLFAGGAVCLGLYGAHARRNPHAILDLTLFNLASFRASVIGGGFMRMAMGATPFMLAMLFQVGFGMSPFQAGLLTFMSAAGALVMKTTAPPILRRFGFRTVLVVNAVITGVIFISYAAFGPDTPHGLIMIVLLVGGFFRSLQFSSLNGLAYAEVEQEKMSRASTMSSMAQQLVQSIGIGLAAMLFHLVMTLRGQTHLTTESISPVFVIIGAITFISLIFYLPLPRNAGDDMTGHHRR